MILSWDGEKRKGVELCTPVMGPETGFWEVGARFRQVFTDSGREQQPIAPETRKRSRKAKGISRLPGIGGGYRSDLALTSDHSAPANEIRFAERVAPNIPQYCPTKFGRAAHRAVSTARAEKTMKKR
jgi:hypothetical protein